MNQSLAGKAQALSASGRWREASSAWQSVVDADQQDAHAWANLGLARAHAGQYPEAVDAFSSGLQQGLPADEVAAGIGLVFCLRQQYDIARENLEMAVRSNPQNLGAWSNLVVCYARLGQISAAFEAAELVLAADPANLSALGSLASLCKDIGLASEAIAWARRAAEADPAKPHLVSNLMWAMLHADEVTQADLLEAGRQFEQRALASIPTSAKPSPRPKGEGGPTGPGEGESANTVDARLPHLSPNPSPRRGGELLAAAPVIKLGWLSGDIRHHAVGRFVVPLLEAIDTERFESFIYNTGHFNDDLTERARKAARSWRDVASLYDAQLAEQIRNDELDILIDLSGHTDGSRLSALVQRPAPVQMSWLGYPDTTGLSCIDYVLVPPDPVLLEGGWCSEKPLALPSYYVRDPSSIDTSTRPARKADKAFTFGCLNNLAKLSPTTIAVWAAILGNEPAARLILVATAGEPDTIAAELRARFATAGANPDQLDIRSRMDFDAYRACWHGIDLALDPFPFNGGTTGFDSLCAGVPFVTLAGAALHSRLGAHLLQAVGLEELITERIEDYIVKAVSLAREPERLTALRAALPGRLRASPLTDIQGFARGFETLLGKITRQTLND